MSGFIAWEVAHRPAALGRAPKCVVLIDSPRLYSQRSAEDEAWIARVTSLRGRFAAMLRLLWRPGFLSRRAIVAQTFAGSLRRVRHELHGRRVPAPAAEWEMDYRRNIDLSTRYRVRPYDGKVVLVRAKIQADWFNRVQHDLGWTRLCAGAFSIVDLPGDHHAIFVEPGVHRLNRALHAAVAGPACEAASASVH
jgi:thioesterase domain-containing protein